MRVGSLVFSTDQGLGYLAKDFYDNGVVTDILVIRHGKRPEHDEWYPGSPRIGSLDDPLIKEFCDSMDVMLFFETPFVWGLLPFCRGRGVKTFLIPMHECMPDPLPYQPDRFICPSLLDLQCYPDRSQFIPIPVPTSVASQWRLRERAEVFVHNAGHGGLRGRNGTREVIEALEYVQSPITFILRSQTRLNVIPFDEVDSGGNDGTRWGGSGRIGNVHLVYWGGTSPAETLYSKGDVFLFPEKFNGCSLPLQEARASGMLVMATDRFPMNTWLPIEPLIQPSGFQRARVSGRCREFEESVINPRNIAAKIDEWYGCDISAYSLQGRAWAEENSWEKLKPRYLEALSR